MAFVVQKNNLGDLVGAYPNAIEDTGVSIAQSIQDYINDQLTNHSLKLFCISEQGGTSNYWIFEPTS